MRFRFRSIPPALTVVALWGALAALSLGAQSWGTNATADAPPPVSTPIAAGRIVLMPVATLEGGPPGVAAALYEYKGQTIILTNGSAVMQPDVADNTPVTGSTTTEPPTVLSR
jgi:hypothetical protein